MANDLTRSPLFIDTPSASMIRTGPVRVANIRWVGATTAGHVLEIRDADERVLYKSVAAGANYTEDRTFEKNRVWSRGFKVPTLQSGELFIEVLDPADG